MMCVQSSELREQLAERMWKIDPRRWPRKPDLIIGGFANTALYGADGFTYGHIADECIRQMQWTHMASKWANPENMTWEDEVLEDGDHPLTLAPEDWKP